MWSLQRKNGMLCVRRKAGGEGVSLYINMTEEQRQAGTLPESRTARCFLLTGHRFFQQLVMGK